MTRRMFAGSLSGPKVDVAIDMGNPFLNVAVDGFLKIGTVAATRAAAEDAYYIVKRGNLSRHNFEHTKNAMLGGALTGILVSSACGHNKDRVVLDAITGGAIATAADFLNYLT